MGIDIGGTKCLGVLARPDGTVLDEVRVPTPGDRAGLLDAIESVTRHLWGHPSMRGVPGSVTGGATGRVGRSSPGSAAGSVGRSFPGSAAGSVGGSLTGAAAGGVAGSVGGCSVGGVTSVAAGSVGRSSSGSAAGSAAGQAGPSGPGGRRVGLGVPGMVDRSGVLRFAPNLHTADGLDVVGAVAERLGLPRGDVRVDNDNTCATWAEHRVGAGRGHDDLLFVALGTGIGGGVVTNGRLVRGRHGFAGELGHICVDPDGPPCPCGQRGCWERYASGAGLAFLARRAAARGELRGVVAGAGDAVEVSGEQITAAAGRGDDGVDGVLDEFARWVAVGVAGLVAVLDPAVVVIGGGLSRSHRVWLPQTRHWFDQLCEGRSYRTTELVPATLGERAAAVGAALLAR